MDAAGDAGNAGKSDIVVGHGRSWSVSDTLRWSDRHLRTVILLKRIVRAGLYIAQPHRGPTRSGPVMNYLDSTLKEHYPCHGKPVVSHSH